MTDGMHDADSHLSDLFAFCLLGFSKLSSLSGKRTKIWIVPPWGSHSREGCRYQQMRCSDISA